MPWDVVFNQRWNHAGNQKLSTSMVQLYWRKLLAGAKLLLKHCKVVKRWKLAETRDQLGKVFRRHARTALQSENKTHYTSFCWKGWTSAQFWLTIPRSETAPESAAWSSTTTAKPTHGNIIRLVPAFDWRASARVFRILKRAGSGAIIFHLLVRAPH